MPRAVLATIALAAPLAIAAPASALPAPKMQHSSPTHLRPHPHRLDPAGTSWAGNR